MEYAIETKNLCKTYRNFKALDNLSIHVPVGSIYGLIGKNGAGKTTLIRLICGLQKPTNGDYKIYGISASSKDILSSRRRMGAIVEVPSIYQDLTARENLEEQFKIVGMPNYEAINDLLKLVGLEGTGKRKVKNFSLGMKQRLGIAITLATNPDLLILDEPINGLDPEGIIEIRELILKLNKKRKITVLISSHYLDELSKIASNYGFLHQGRIIKEISNNELNNLCGKKIVVTVSNVNECVKYLEEKKLKYKLQENNVINIYAKLNISKFVLDLSKVNCEVKDFREIDESLESFYMNLIGGANNG